MGHTSSRTRHNILQLKAKSTQLEISELPWFSRQNSIHNSFMYLLYDVGDLSGGDTLELGTTIPSIEQFLVQQCVTWCFLCLSLLLSLLYVVDCDITNEWLHLGTLHANLYAIIQFISGW